MFRATTVSDTELKARLRRFGMVEGQFQVKRVLIRDSMTIPQTSRLDHIHVAINRPHISLRIAGESRCPTCNLLQGIDNP